MITRRASAAFLSVILLASCDAGITGPTSDHLSSLSLAGSFACGIDAEGRAFCWGGDNASGQLGDGTNRPSTTPVRVKTGVRFQQVVAAAAHACGLATDGRVFCWGDNTSSQLGVRTTDLDCNLLQPNGWVQDFANACSTVPTPVETSLRFVQLGAGPFHTCARTSGGQIWCWGDSNYGLGDSAVTGESDSLIRVANVAAFTTMAIGINHACASGADGQGYCWGGNYDGELGRGAGASAFGPTPAPINSSAFIKRWAVGQLHTCALTGAGEALCWGIGQSGQLGDSTTTSSQPDPVYVKTALRFTQVAAAGGSTCALESGTGAAWCWGENSSGQLGDGTTFDRLAPAPVLGGLSFHRLVMGTDSWYGGAATTCGSSEGRFYCWGLLPQPLTFEE